MTAITRGLVSLTMLLISAGGLVAQERPTVTADVVYGHKDGMALVMHVFQPTKPNGASVIQIVSGGYISEWGPAEPYIRGLQPYLSSGYTVFTVFHGSSPRYTVVDAAADMRRAVRFIRSRASQFAIDPDRIGAVGASAGGHLALMLATTGDDGDAAALDPVGRAGSRVAAAVAIAAPSDFQEPDSVVPMAVKRGGTTEAGGKRLQAAFNFERTLGSTVSPVRHVTPDDAPTLLIHGDADLLVPVENSKQMYAQFQSNRVSSEFVALAGVGHGTASTPSGREELGKITSRAAAWFDRYLIAKPKP